MSPSRISESQMVITPLKHAENKKCKLGAIVTGLDLNNVSDDDLATLKEATHRYQLLMIKDQHDLNVKKHWELVTRLDPTAHEVHGHGTVEQFAKTGGMLAVGDSLPDCRT